MQYFFFTTKFQQRGNEHEHGLLWIQDALAYGKTTNDEIDTFIEYYISIDSSLLNEKLLKV